MNKDFENNIDSDIPEIKCKAAVLNKVMIFLLIVFSVFAGIFCYIFLKYFILGSELSGIKLVTMAILVLSFAVPIWGAIFVKHKYDVVYEKGEDLRGKILGYINDEYYINGEPAKILRILIDDDKGKRIIRYNTGQTEELYPVGMNVHLKLYKGWFRVCDE
ncbi:hypothetical protein [Butyrivibrio sp. WCD3002]|uniref:hypothetical protein n=1 Tax=Butyrivibrio sp. WCD3002 TaxID=1280676 RepID=UPI000429FA38|nr:hypothetical protein [Butyrivibrio sp. WCD3002]